MFLFFCSTGRQIVCVCCASKEACMYSYVSTHGLETLLYLSLQSSPLPPSVTYLYDVSRSENSGSPASASVSTHLLSSSSMSTQLHSVPIWPPSAAPTTRFSPSKFFPKWGHVASLHMDHHLHMPPPITLPPSPFLSTAFFFLSFFSLSSFTMVWHSFQTEFYLLCYHFAFRISIALSPLLILTDLFHFWVWDLSSCLSKSKYNRGFT